VVSLFCGSGGLDLGFEKAGFEPLLALDIDPAAVETYNRNRPPRHEPARIADLSSASPSAMLEWWEAKAGNRRPVGVIGGPPCQAFSVSTAHKLEDDPRAKLPLAYARILDVFNKRFDLEFFVFENVAGLGHRRHSSLLAHFLREFAGAGFQVRLFCLDAVMFGVPQYRRRMFIVGFNKRRYDASSFVVPRGDGVRLTVRQVIGDLPEPVYFSRVGPKPADVGLHPNHWSMNPRSEKFLNGALQSGKMVGRSFRVLKMDAPSWTVAYGHREVHVHPNGKRRLSVYEAMLLQAFPSSYELGGTLSDQIRLVSDAVPPPLAYALAKSIRYFVAHPSTPARAKAQVVARGQARQLGLPGLHTASPRSTNA